MLSSSAVACIIVNYNGCAKTLACLDAVASLSSPLRTVCVVDNSSLPGESAALLQSWTELSLKRGFNAPRCAPFSPKASLQGGLFLPQADNLGFAAGNNAALRLLLADPGCRAFWLLNNDTLPRPDALEALVRRMNQRLDVGMVGSTLLRPCGTVLQTAAGTTLSPLTGITRDVLARLSLAEATQCDAARVESTLATVCGASCLVRRSALEKAGLMDERFFLYYEDVEWSLRVRKAGYGLAWAKTSVVVHEEGGSTPGGETAHAHTALVDYLSYRNRLRLMLAHYPLGVPTTLLSFVYAFCKRMLRGEPAKAMLVLKAAGAALRGEEGCK